MKNKYLWLLAISAMLTLTSCHKDNDTTSDMGKIEKATSISYGDYGDYTYGKKQIEIMEWDGNKLKKYTLSDDLTYVFNYDGDKLIEFVSQNPRDGSIRWRYTYAYTNDLLTELDGPGGHFKINYNDDGYVASASYIGSDYRNDTYQLTWQDGNLVKYVRRYEKDTLRWTTTVTYTYDNIKSWKKGSGVFAFCHYNYGFSPDGLETKNNKTSMTFHNTLDSGGEYNRIEHYNYTYSGNYVKSFTHSSSDEVFHPSTTYLKYTNSSDPSVPTTYKVTAKGVYGRGSVTGGGDYVSGKTVKLRANPMNGYHFTGWSNGSNSNPLTFTVTNDVEYQANFEPDK